MHKLTAGLFGLALLSYSAGAFASPMTYTATKFEHGGGVGFGGLVIIPDLAQGGRFHAGTGVPRGGEGYVDNSGAVHQTLDYPLSFVIDYGDWTIGEPGVVVRLNVDGHVTGSMVTNAKGYYFGSFVGEATGIELAYPNGPPGADVPQPLLDLLAHPERIRLEGFAGEGYGSAFFSTYLTIAPATSVPEPSALLVAACLAGAVALHRRAVRRPS